ncbi:MAG: FAD:protein FMN transferase [Planctomycetales bacterium]|nr:FAD:protein FMN transferase [Planctomycetales bacterium]
MTVRRLLLLSLVVGVGLGRSLAVDAEETAATDLRRFEFAEPHMGTQFALVFYAANDRIANQAARLAFARIATLDRCLTDYDAASESRRLAARFDEPVADGEFVPVSQDLWDVLTASLELSRRTDGAFDVTVGPLTYRWRRVRRRKELMPPDTLAQARTSVGFDLIQMHPDRRAVRLAKSGMRLDFGGIAKGYAADEARSILAEQGITRALVNAGGDLVLGDPPPGKSGWQVGVAPLARDGAASRTVPLANCGVATSGDVWQYVEIDGQRYSHILDPKTGLGLTTRVAVTVIARSGAEADGLASAVSVMGPEKGLQAVELWEGTEALVVSAKEDDVQIEESSGFPSAD